MTRDERFEACFLKYKNLVMRFVIDATGDYQAAQEICQQVFVRYYEYIDRVSPDFENAIGRKQTACTSKASTF